MAPICRVAVAGVTSIDAKVAELTVKLAVLDLPLKLAVIFDVPVAAPVATPLVCTTVPMPGVLDVQVVNAVTSRLEPSL